MEAVVAVVDCAFRDVAEDVVSGGNAGEALACVWVCAIAVWVVAHGEGVELSRRLEVLDICGIESKGGGRMLKLGVLFDLRC
jgi:hypothetical protein